MACLTDRVECVYMCVVACFNTICSSLKFDAAVSHHYSVVLRIRDTYSVQLGYYLIDLHSSYFVPSYNFTCVIHH